MPAAIAWRARSAWVGAGVATTTASTMPSSVATSGVMVTAGYCRASFSRIPADASHTATSSAPGSAARVRT